MQHSRSVAESQRTWRKLWHTRSVAGGVPGPNEKSLAETFNESFFALKWGHMSILCIGRKALKL